MVSRFVGDRTAPYRYASGVAMISAASDAPAPTEPTVTRDRSVASVACAVAGAVAGAVARSSAAPPVPEGRAWGRPWVCPTADAAGVSNVGAALGPADTARPAGPERATPSTHSDSMI